MSGSVSMAVWIRIDELPAAAVAIGDTQLLHVAGSIFLNVFVELASRNVTFTLLDEVGDSHCAVGVASSLEPRQWLHLAVSHTPGQELAIYADGARIFSGDADFTFQAGAAAFTLAGSWRGALTGLRVMSCDLTTLDAMALARTGDVSARISSATVARWTFELSGSMRNGSYSASLWPSLTSTAGDVAIVLNSEVSHLSIEKQRPAAWYPGTVVAGPGCGSSSAWALQLDGHMVQTTSNLRNGTLLEYLSLDQEIDYVVLWNWSDIW
jgi:hypothetical protein